MKLPDLQAALSNRLSRGLHKEACELLVDKCAVGVVAWLDFTSSRSGAGDHASAATQLLSNGLKAFEGYEKMEKRPSESVLMSHVECLAGLITLQLRSASVSLAEVNLRKLDSLVYSLQSAQSDKRNWKNWLRYTQAITYHLCGIFLLLKMKKGLSMDSRKCISQAAFCFGHVLELCPQLAVADAKNAEGWQKHAGFIVFEAERVLSHLRRENSHVDNMMKDGLNTSEQASMDLFNNLFSVRRSTNTVDAAHASMIYSTIIGGGGIKPEMLNLSESQVAEIFKGSIYFLPNSLDAALWSLLQFWDFENKCFTVESQLEDLFQQDLQFGFGAGDLSTSSIDTLCLLDVQVFLYLSAYCVASRSTQRSTATDPMVLSDAMCSEWQQKWWDAVLSLTSNKGRVDQRPIVQQGLEVIRLIRSQSMELRLIHAAAKMLQQSVECFTDEKQSVVITYAREYWKHLVDRCESNRVGGGRLDNIAAGRIFFTTALPPLTEDEREDAVAEARNYLNADRSLLQGTPLSNGTTDRRSLASGGAGAVQRFSTPRNSAFSTPVASAYSPYSMVDRHPGSARQRQENGQIVGALSELANSMDFTVRSLTQSQDMLVRSVLEQNNSLAGTCQTMTELFKEFVEQLKDMKTQDKEERRREREDRGRFEEKLMDKLENLTIGGSAPPATSAQPVVAQQQQPSYDYSLQHPMGMFGAAPGYPQHSMASAGPNTGGLVCPPPIPGQLPPPPHIPGQFPGGFMPHHHHQLHQQQQQQLTQYQQHLLASGVPPAIVANQMAALNHAAAVASGGGGPGPFPLVSGTSSMGPTDLSFQNTMAGHHVPQQQQLPPQKGTTRTKVTGTGVAEISDAEKALLQAYGGRDMNDIFGANLSRLQQDIDQQAAEERQRQLAQLNNSASRDQDDYGDGYNFSTDSLIESSQLAAAAGGLAAKGISFAGLNNQSANQGSSPMGTVPPGGVKPAPALLYGQAGVSKQPLIGTSPIAAPAGSGLQFPKQSQDLLHSTPKSTTTGTNLGLNFGVAKASAPQVDVPGTTAGAVVSSGPSVFPTFRFGAPVSSAAPVSVPTFGGFGLSQQPAAVSSGGTSLFGNVPQTGATTAAPALNNIFGQTPSALDVKKSVSFSTEQGRAEDLRTTPGRADSSGRNVSVCSDTSHASDYDPHYDPIVPLPDVVEVRTGEEEETVLFAEKSNLYRWADSQWKERGKGILKILENPDTNRCRIVMRREQVHKVCANHAITKDMHLNPHHARPTVWIWVALDFSEDPSGGEPATEQFCARFGSKEIAQSFKDIFESAAARDSVASAAASILAPADPLQNNNNNGGGLKPMFSIATPQVSPGHGGKQASPQQLSNNVPATPPPATTAAAPGGLFGALSGKTGCQATPPAPGMSKPVFGSLFGAQAGSFTTPPTSNAAAGGPAFGGGASLFGVSSVTPSKTSIPASQSTTSVSPTLLFKPSILGSVVNTTPPVGTSSVSPNAALTAKPPAETVAAPPPATTTVTSSAAPFNFGGFSFTAPPKIVTTTASSNVEPQATAPVTTAAAAPVFGKFSFATPSTTTQQQPVVGSSPMFGSIGGSTGPSLSFSSVAQGFQSDTTDVGFSTTSAQSGTGSFSAFPGAGAPVFGSKGKTTTDSGGDTSGAGGDEEYEPDVDFKPVVPLPELIEVKTGEENEEVLFSERAKLFRYDNDAGAFKERGLGICKILKHPTTNQRRIVMRREQVLKLCANHRISQGMKLQPMAKSDRAYTWRATDYSEGELSQETLAIKFKSVDQANAFKKTFELCTEATVTAVPVSSDGGGDSANKNQQQPPVSTSDKNQPPSAAYAALVASNKGKWECSGCMIRNAPDVNVCPCCGTGQDGTPPAPGAGLMGPPMTTSSTFPASTFGGGGFSFGLGAGDHKTENQTATAAVSSTSSSSTGFSFGFGGPTPVTTTSSTVTSSSTSSAIGFSFTNALKTTSQTTTTTTDAGASPIASQHHRSDSGGEYYDNEKEDAGGDGPHFEPLVHVPEQDTPTGEEGDAVLFESRAKLYRFHDGQNRERGLGTFKILKNEETGKIRGLLRRDIILNLACNFVIYPGMTLTKKGETAYTFYTKDFSEGELTDEVFTLKFKDATIAQCFNKVWSDITSDPAAAASNSGSPTTTTASSPLDKFSFKSAATKDTTSSGGGMSLFGNSTVKELTPKPAAEAGGLFGGSVPTTSPSSLSSPTGAGFFSANNSESRTSFGSFSFTTPTGASSVTSPGTATSPKPEADQDVEVVFDGPNVTPEQEARAVRLQLPRKFFAYENLPGSKCPGCRGCDEESEDESPPEVDQARRLDQEVPSYDYGTVDEDALNNNNIVQGDDDNESENYFEARATLAEGSPFKAIGVGNVGITGDEDSACYKIHFFGDTGDISLSHSIGKNADPKIEQVARMNRYNVTWSAIDSLAVGRNPDAPIGQPIQFRLTFSSQHTANQCMEKFNEAIKLATLNNVESARSPLNRFRNAESDGLQSLLSSLAANNMQGNEE